MLRVGLTGGVGSGKSRVADMLAELGARVSRSDEIGRAMMQPGQPVLAAIVERFGAALLRADGTLDRAALARIAFNEGRLEELNELVHPAVIAAQSRWMDEIAAQEPEAVAVIESALIFETRHGGETHRKQAEPGNSSDAATETAPWRTRFDRIIVVTAPQALRRERYVRRFLDANVDAAPAGMDFDRRARAQWSDERKAALADHVLQNDGSIEELAGRVAKLYSLWRQEAIDLKREAM